MTLQESLSQHIKQAFVTLYNTPLETVEFQATRKDFEGDITVVTFSMLRTIKMNPAQLGEDLGAYLSEHIDEVVGYNVVKGFLNLVISDVYFMAFFQTVNTNPTFGFVKPKNASAGKVLTWTLPSVMDGLGVVTSYNMSAAAKEATIGYALTYTGVEGLSVSYGFGEVGGNTAGTTGAEVTTMKASFAFGPVTAAMSINDYDITGASNEEQSSYSISYSVSDELSISYGSETHETVGDTTDEEFDQISVSYTTGGLTASVRQTNADNVDGATNTEQSQWNVGLSFAF